MGDLSPANPDRDGDPLDIALPVWRSSFEANLLGCTHLPRMIEQGYGVTINTSSGAVSGILRNRPAYSASTKASVEVITRHIASRWGKQGIRCNAVSPGLVLG